MSGPRVSLVLTDQAQVVLWLALLSAGVGLCLWLRRRGVASTYLRDLLHVSAGLWCLGWPSWHGGVAPVLLAACVAGATALLAALPARLRPVALLRQTLTGPDETMGGVVVYGVSAAYLTVLAFEGAVLPAGGALCALALGDGLGGLVGRRYGRCTYPTPFGKPKTLEGSLTVAVASLGAVVGWAAFVGLPLGLGVALGVALAASLVEALAPRGSDNLLVPLVVYALLRAAA